MRAIAILVCTLALAACATASTYAPARSASSAGFSDTRIESGRYRVTYRGTSADAAERVSDLALLRAAEITLRDGAEWFVVDNRSDERRGGGGPSMSVGVGGGSFGRRSSVGVGVGVGVPIGGGGALRSVTLDIRTGRGAKPAEQNAYDAREVQSTVRARM